jgi:hypothetical protein
MLELKQPEPSSAHKLLDAFIGDWHAEGTSYGDHQDAADPRAGSMPWVSDESYEWLSHIPKTTCGWLLCVGDIRGVNVSSGW